jgi:hypothetical protein
MRRGRRGEDRHDEDEQDAQDAQDAAAVKSGAGVSRRDQRETSPAANVALAALRRAAPFRAAHSPIASL